MCQNVENRIGRCPGSNFKHSGNLKMSVWKKSIIGYGKELEIIYAQVTSRNKALGLIVNTKSAGLELVSRIRFMLIFIVVGKR